MLICILISLQLDQTWSKALVFLVCSTMLNKSEATLEQVMDQILSYENDMVAWLTL
jgi:hypothetical protein